jgi:diacylglycerol kinase (ATP)
MQKDMPQKLLFIINPVSGGKTKTDWEVVIRDYFKEQPHNMEFYIMTGKDDTSSVKLYLERLKPDKVVAVGGDGTIKMVAELVVDTPTILGLLPAGSANGMAKELNIPLTPLEALDIAVNGQSKAIDVLKVNNKEIGLHLSDIGLNALLVKYFEQSGKRGMWGYVKGVFKVMANKQLMYVTIKTDTETIKRKAYMVVIANASKYGTGAVINPDGCLWDGLLEVVVIRRLHFVELLKTLIKHKGFNEEYIEVFKTKKLQLSTMHKAHFQVDGEYRDRTKNINVMVLPQALKVMLPAATEA